MMVSVITPTWQRHTALLDRCIPSVQAQIWPEVEHIVISDGPDDELAGLLPADVRYVQMVDHLEGPIDYGSRARNAGLTHALGSVIAYLDDDNAWRPEHLAVLVDALGRIGRPGFAYSQMIRHPWDDVIGSSPPAHGGIDTSIIAHPRGLPEQLGMWPLPDEITGDKHAPDWAVVSRWLANGAAWAHVQEVTVDYYFAGS